MSVAISLTKVLILRVYTGSQTAWITLYAAGLGWSM